mmetsp:Transcript_112910/g.269021  ORF Transcript_112910/g.269021 Transcript_112910/m.269021 type:complete len:202 (+) Transcript_112910:247-852(+)
MGFSDSTRHRSSESFRSTAPSSRSSSSSTSGTDARRWRPLNSVPWAWAFSLASATALAAACCLEMRSLAAGTSSKASGQGWKGWHRARKPCSVMRLRPRPRYSRPRYASSAKARSSAPLSQMRLSQRFKALSCQGHFAKAVLIGPSSKRLMAQARKLTHSRTLLGSRNPARLRPRGSSSPISGKPCSASLMTSMVTPPSAP